MGFEEQVHGVFRKSGHDSSNWLTFFNGENKPNIIANKMRNRTVVTNKMITTRPPWSQGFSQSLSFQIPFCFVISLSM